MQKSCKKNLEIGYEKENTDTIRYDIFGNELKCDDIVLILQYDVVNIGYITSFDKDDVGNVYCHDAGENREKLCYTKELIKFENYKDLLK